MAEQPYEAVDVYEDLEDAEPQRPENDGTRDEKGRFVEGNNANPGGMGSTAGVVAYVKSITSDCFEMVDLFVTVMRGEKLKNSDFIAGPKERMQAASELFDRAIGKPKQTIEETGDDHGKEVLASLQKLYELRSAGDIAQTAFPKTDESTSVIDQMKRKPDVIDGAMNLGGDNYPETRPWEPRTEE